MTILSHISNVRFIVEYNGKYFLISIINNEAIEINDPNEIYRQGYWELYMDDDKQLKERCLSIINSKVR